MRMFWASFQELKIMIWRLRDIFCDWPEMGGSCCCDLYDDLQNNYECPCAGVVGEVGLGDGAPQGPNQNPHMLGSWQILIPSSYLVLVSRVMSHCPSLFPSDMLRLFLISCVLRVFLISYPHYLIILIISGEELRLWSTSSFYPLVAPFILCAHIRPIPLATRQP